MPSSRILRLLSLLALVVATASPLLAHAAPSPIGGASSAAAGTAVASNATTATTAADRASAAAPHESQVEQLSKWHLLHKFYKTFLYPNNLVPSKAGHTDLFAEDIQGRVDVTGTFVGNELNTEYIFGLFADVQGAKYPTLLMVPLSYKIFAFAAEGAISSSSTIVEFMHVPTKIRVPSQLDAFIRYDSKGRITQYDVVFRREVFAMRYAMPLLVPYILANTNATDTPPDQITPELVAKLAQQLQATSICKTHTDHCLGKNQQYASEQACIEFLTTKVRLGEVDESGMDTVSCRSLHMNMIPFRPDVHCAHVGPTGGGMCVDRDYLSVVYDNFFKKSFIASNRH